MRKRILLGGAAAILLAAIIPAEALQCVPYAREASGISLRGDAWTWWNGAAGIYDRGHAPRLGAVVVFRKFGSMRRGHVAVVVRIVDSREVLVDHANWGPRRGVISTMAAVRDVSPHNDWTEVRVWNATTRDFGIRVYPTYGFIYPIVSRGRIEEARLSKQPPSWTYPEDGASFDEMLPAVVAQALADAGSPDVAATTSAAATRTDMPTPDIAVDVISSPTATTALFQPVVLETDAVVGQPAPSPIPVAVDTLAAPKPAPTVAVAAVPAIAANMAAVQPSAVASTSPAARAAGVWEGDAAAALQAGSGRY